MGARFAAFNVFGIRDRDIAGSVLGAVATLPPSDPDVAAIAFSEVWHPHQRDLIVKTWVGDGASSTRLLDVTIHRSGQGKWRCLVPVVPPVSVPLAPALPLSSGLALCVQGTVKDAFFHEFKGGEVPDKFAHKGVLAALVQSPGQPRRAVIATHFHDSSNDAFGRGRSRNLEDLASCLNWIGRNWDVPVMMLGDFNIDSRFFYDPARAVDTPTRSHASLYSMLVRLNRQGQRAWWDANARFSNGKPVPTHDGGGCIDHHFGSPGAGAPPHFSALNALSDHFLTISEWT